MSPDKALNLTEANALSVEQFTRIFGNVIEHSPEAALSAAAMRPFPSQLAFKEAFNVYLGKLDTAGKHTVLLKHPDLGRKSMTAAELLTIESQNEQEVAGLHAISDQQEEELNRLNRLYKEKFRFPFVICARENGITSIVEAMAKRLKNSPADELNTSINEIKKICGYRIDALLLPSDK